MWLYLLDGTVQELIEFLAITDYDRCVNFSTFRTVKLLN